ncbi:hypothetical protein C8Q76DRAFT_800353 [Earliella scabrosa]|nr:hypothetical protein C8Q76DRAFT_800353 [Earliella scabrosa]
MNPSPDASRYREKSAFHEHLSGETQLEVDDFASSLPVDHPPQHSPPDEVHHGAHDARRSAYGGPSSLVIFYMTLVVPCSMLVTFGLAVTFIMVVLAPALLGACAILDAFAFLLAGVAAWYAGKCGASRTVVFWSLEVVGTVVAGAFVPITGVAVWPHLLESDVFTAAQALKAGLLGMVVVSVSLVLVIAFIYVLFCRRQQISESVPIFLAAVEPSSATVITLQKH